MVDRLRALLRARGGDPAGRTERHRPDHGVDPGHAAAARSGDARGRLLHRCWLAYLSDDLPCDSVVRAHPRRAELEADEGRFMASLDHTIWFHRTPHADRWHLYDVSTHHFGAGRGVTIGHVFDADGVLLATFAQEALLRERSG